MRRHGRLIRWNDERGFGFISPAQGDTDLFVHVSAFPKGGRRPVLNELISFETEMGPKGKLRAIRIGRAGDPPKSRQKRTSETRSIAGRLAFAFLGMALIATVGTNVYNRHEVAGQTVAHQARPLVKQELPSRSFTCDGRTVCSQMTSCAEATYFIRHCPGTTMDGDNDGRPCESQWCNDSQ